MRGTFAETDAELIGWSEYNESYGSKGLTVVIMKLAEMLIGQDPRPVELITANLYTRTRQAPGGIIQQAIAAIGPCGRRFRRPQ